MFVTHSFTDWINLWGVNLFQIATTPPVKINIAKVNNKTTAIGEQEIWLFFVESIATIFITEDHTRT